MPLLLLLTITPFSQFRTEQVDLVLGKDLTPAPETMKKGKRNILAAVKIGLYMSFSKLKTCTFSNSGGRNGKVRNTFHLIS